MTTRKIRLSQTMTLSFRDISMSVADVGNAAASISNQETDQANSNETFDSLPDLLPYIFQSQEKLSVPDVSCFVTDCSPHKLWESCIADAIPLASQSEGAEHWLLAGTQISRADNLQANDSDSIPLHGARIGVRENLRRVQAFSPHTSNIVFYDVDLGESRSEDFRGALADVTCNAATEFGSQPYVFDIYGDTDGTICPDSYLNLDEGNTKVDSPLVEFPVADVTRDAAIEIGRKPDHVLNIGDNTDGVFADRYLDNVLNENMSHLTEEADSPPKEPTVADAEMVNSRVSSISEARLGGQKEHNGTAHSGIKKTRTKSLKSPHQASDFYSLDFPKKIRKQKRSIAPRRRELGHSSSIDLLHKTNWMYDAVTKQDHLGVPSDQGPQVTANLPDEEEKKTSQTRKTRKRTVSISSARKLFREPPGDQNVKPKPRGRPGKKKKNDLDQQLD